MYTSMDTIERDQQALHFLKTWQLAKSIDNEEDLKSIGPKHVQKDWIRTA